MVVLDLSATMTHADEQRWADHNTVTFDVLL